MFGLYIIKCFIPSQYQYQYLDAAPYPYIYIIPTPDMSPSWSWSWSDPYRYQYSSVLTSSYPCISICFIGIGWSQIYFFCISFSWNNMWVVKWINMCEGKLKFLWSFVIQVISTIWINPLNLVFQEILF